MLHYGLPLQSLALTKAHRSVEGSHRAAAWRVVLDHVEAERRLAVVETMQRVLQAWQGYRDDVAAAVGLRRGPDGRPTLAHAA